MSTQSSSASGAAAPSADQIRWWHRLWFWHRPDAPFASPSDFFDAYYGDARPAGRRADFEAQRVAFERRHGRILNAYFCPVSRVAGLLTDRDEIHFSVPLREADPALADLLLRCEAAHIEARHILGGADLRICSEMIFATITHLLDLHKTTQSAAPGANGTVPAEGTAPAARPAGRKEEAAGIAPVASALAAVEEELRAARAHYTITAQRAAQIAYFNGMLFGLVALALLCGFALWLARGRMEPNQQLPLLLTPIAGGFGALVSVLARMTAGKCVLEFRTGWRFLFRMGACRPVVGAIFGLVLYALLRAELLPVRVPPAGVQPYFFAALAFLAGFSERVAQDMLVVAGQGLAPGVERTLSSGWTDSEQRGATDVTRGRPLPR